MVSFIQNARLLLILALVGVAPAPLLAQDARSVAVDMAADCVAYFDGFIEAGSFSGVPLDRNLELSRRSLDVLADLNGKTVDGVLSVREKVRKAGAKAAKTSNAQDLNEALAVCREVDRIAEEVVRLGPDVGSKAMRCYGVVNGLADYATGADRQKFVAWAGEVWQVAIDLQAVFGRGQTFDKAGVNAAVEEGRATGRHLATSGSLQPQVLDPCIALRDLRNSLAKLYAHGPLK